MIELTPLDVRNKRGDFKRLMRGYDPDEVDVFLELVAERMEALVRENIQYRERTATLQSQVTSASEREQAVQDALVTAQELRADIKAQSQREADHILKEAETEARRLIAEADAEVRTKLRGAERRFDDARDALAEMERRRDRFLKEFRQLLQREMDVVEVEEQRQPHEERAIELDLGADPTPPPPAEEPEAVSVEADDVEHAEVSAEPDVVDEAEETTQELEPVSPVTATISPEEPLATGEAPIEGAVAAAPVEVVAESVPEPTVAEVPEEPVVADPAYRADQPTVSLDELGPDEPPVSHDASVILEAEAVAEAGAPVEVTPLADGLAVPRLEEVLAEAGAEFVETQPQGNGGDVEEIAPPPVRETPAGGQDDTLLLYLDNPDQERGGL